MTPLAVAVVVAILLLLPGESSPCYTPRQSECRTSVESRCGLVERGTASVRLRGAGLARERECV